jgi:hypothetical protein
MRIGAIKGEGAGLGRRRRCWCRLYGANAGELGVTERLGAVLLLIIVTGDLVGAIVFLMLIRQLLFISIRFPLNLVPPFPLRSRGDGPATR